MPYTLVAGGSSPLGKTICQTLMRKGFPLVIQYHKNREAALMLEYEAANNRHHVMAVEADFSTLSGVENFVAKLGKENIAIQNLIYSIGPYHIGSGLTTEVHKWQNLYQLNLWSAIRLIQLLVPELEKRQGSLITIGVAGIGRNHANCYNTSYVNAKEALWHATLSFAKELAPKHVRVNMVAPGHLETSVDLEKFRDKIPTGMPVSLEEVAHLVSYLLSDQARSITGQKIEVHGGAIM